MLRKNLQRRRTEMMDTVSKMEETIRTLCHTEKKRFMGS